MSVSWLLEGIEELPERGRGRLEKQVPEHRRRRGREREDEPKQIAVPARESAAPSPAPKKRSAWDSVTPIATVAILVVVLASTAAYLADVGLPTNVFYSILIGAILLVALVFGAQLLRRGDIGEDTYRNISGKVLDKVSLRPGSGDGEGSE